MEDAAQQLRRRSNNEKPPPPATPPPAGTLATRQVVGAAPSTTSSGAVDGSATVYILLVLCTLVAGAGIQLAAMRLLGYTWCAEPAAGLTQTSARSRHVSSASAASYAVAQDHAKAARSNAGSGQKKALFVKRSVNFVNNRDEIVELYWVGSTQGVQSPQLLADIPAGEESGFVTYTVSGQRDMPCGHGACVPDSDRLLSGLVCGVGIRIISGKCDRSLTVN